MSFQRPNRLLAAVVPLIAVLVLFSTVAYAAPVARANDESTQTLDLAFFSPKATGQGVVLSWRTGPEANVAGFNIFRTQGADDWQKVNDALIVATGGLSERNDYAWTDTSAKAGQSYYYRLEHVLADGATTAHEPVRIKAGAPLRLGLDEFKAQSLASLLPAVIGAVVAVGGFSLLRRRK